MNGVPLISKNLSGVSNVNVSGDVTAQTIQSSLGIYLNGIRSNVQAQIDTVAVSKQGIQGNVGIQGNIGIQGIQGNIGIQGIQGVQGSKDHRVVRDHKVALDLKGRHNLGETYSLF